MLEINLNDEEIEQDAISAARKHSFLELEEVDAFIDNVTKIIKK